MQVDGKQVSKRLLDREISTAEEETVEAGSHDFHFDFPVQATQAGSITSRHGRIAYRYIARAEGLGRFGAAVRRAILALYHGLCAISWRRRVRRASVSDEQSDRRAGPIQIVPAPGMPGDAAPPASLSLEDLVPDLGVRCTILCPDSRAQLSQPFRTGIGLARSSVGCLAFFEITFPSPGVAAAILLIEASIIEHCDVSLPNSDAPPPLPKPTSRVLFHVGATSQDAPRPFTPGIEWEWQRFARMPDHRSLSPSTSPKTITPLRFSHEVRSHPSDEVAVWSSQAQVLLKITFRVNDSGSVRLLEQRKPIFIYSCADYAELPIYESVAPVFEDAEDGKLPCECEKTTEGLIIHSGEALKQMTARDSSAGGVKPAAVQSAS